MNPIPVFDEAALSRAVKVSIVVLVIWREGKLVNEGRSSSQQAHPKLKTSETIVIQCLV